MWDKTIFIFFAPSPGSTLPLVKKSSATILLILGHPKRMHNLYCLIMLFIQSPSSVDALGSLMIRSYQRGYKGRLITLSLSVLIRLRRSWRAANISSLSWYWHSDTRWRDYGINSSTGTLLLSGKCESFISIKAGSRSEQQPVIFV